MKIVLDLTDSEFKVLKAAVYFNQREQEKGAEASKALYAKIQEQEQKA